MAFKVIVHGNGMHEINKVNPKSFLNQFHLFCNLYKSQDPTSQTSQNRMLKGWAYVLANIVLHVLL